MDFSKIVKDAKEKAILNFKPLNAQGLVPGEYYSIQKVNMYETGKGKSVKVTLVDGRMVWLPSAYAQAMEKDHVENINAANNYEMAFLGMIKDGSSEIPNVDVRIKEEEEQKHYVQNEIQPGPSVTQTDQHQRKGVRGQGNLVRVMRGFIIEGDADDISEGYYQLGDPIIISDDE